LFEKDTADTSNSFHNIILFDMEIFAENNDIPEHHTDGFKFYEAGQLQIYMQLFGFANYF
jgi:hypothetical protein